MATAGGHGIVAGADLSTYQFRILVLDSSGDAQLSDATARGMLGVMSNEPVSGQPVAFYDLAKGDITGQVEAGAAVAIGQGIVSDSVGRGIAATGDTEPVCGMALQAAGAAGDIIKFKVRDVHSPDYDKEFLS